MLLPIKMHFFLLYCVVSELITNLSQVVARGDGCYELQSTTCVYGILLISHHLSTVKLSTIQWLTERLPFYLMLSFYTVPSLQFVIMYQCFLPLFPSLVYTRGISSQISGGVLCIQTPCPFATSRLG